MYHLYTCNSAFQSSRLRCCISMRPVLCGGCCCVRRSDTLLPRPPRRQRAPAPSQLLKLPGQAEEVTGCNQRFAEFAKNMDGGLGKKKMLQCRMCFVPAISTAAPLGSVSAALHLTQRVRGRQNCLGEADLMGCSIFASPKLFTGGGRRILFQPSIDLRICEVFANRE